MSCGRRIFPKNAELFEKVVMKLQGGMIIRSWSVRCGMLEDFQEGERAITEFSPLIDWLPVINIPRVSALAQLH